MKVSVRVILLFSDLGFNVIETPPKKKKTPEMRRERFSLVLLLKFKFTPLFVIIMCFSF